MSYKIEYWNQLFQIWIPYDSVEYSSLQAAKKEIESYQEHKLGVKFRILKIETVYTDK